MFHESDRDLALFHLEGYFEVEKQHKSSSQQSQVPVSTHRDELQFVQKEEKLPMRLNWNGGTERSFLLPTNSHLREKTHTHHPQQGRMALPRHREKLGGKRINK